MYVYTKLYVLISTDTLVEPWHPTSHYIQMLLKLLLRLRYHLAAPPYRRVQFRHRLRRNTQSGPLLDLPLLNLHPLQMKRREHRHLKPGKAHLR